jgi:LmbE family N-acetylglucosaminyl deacetylase
MKPLLSRVLRRRDDGALTSAPDLRAALGRPGPWLAIAPHDDDIVLGMGLAVAAAAAEGVEIHLAVTSDGGLGYLRPADRPALIEVRRREMLRCAVALGVPEARVHFLGLPDGSLMANQGAVVKPDGQVTGVGRALTAIMRRVRPTVVFGPTPTDLHPDHRAVASELDIACFWASGGIWLELGEPIDLPVRWDYAVYCPFAADPQLQLTGTAEGFQRKLDGIAAFASQPAIDGMVVRIREAGPVEYLREVTWTPYHPAAYAPLFSGAPLPAGGRA